MAEPWLSIIGLGEDGLHGLSAASRKALEGAELIFGGPRHLALIEAGHRGRTWPIPFSVAPVLEARGARVAVLASGDPFWHGAGGSLTRDLDPGEWHCWPAVSTFSLAAARLGWRLEDVLCLGLHAAPLDRLRPLLGQGVRALCLLRDAAAPAELAAWLTSEGFGHSRLTILECLGGPRERLRKAEARSFALPEMRAPVAVAVEAAGSGLPRAGGLPDEAFEHDGQITKRPVRALTLSALAPRMGETLWDIGAGSGSISVEWLLAAPGSRAVALEADAGRAARARRNADRFGLGHRFVLHELRAPEGIADLPRPDAIFVGGGASETVLETVWQAMPENCRLVANAVTLETEALLARWSGAKGGTLLRIELAEAQPLGTRRGWRSSLPVVQWSVVR